MNTQPGAIVQEGLRAAEAGSVLYTELIGFADELGGLMADQTYLLFGQFHCP